MERYKTDIQCYFHSTAHRAHRMTDAEILGADLLLAMTDAHHRVLAET